MDTHDDTLHVILGAGGAIGTSLAAELLPLGRRLRTVSRTGRGADGAEVLRGDLTNPGDVLRAVEEGAIVYLLAGLPYDRRVWREQWPAIMRNVISACATKAARLIFFDNVYMYGSVAGPMTEETPVHPTSEKGKIRAHIANLLTEAIAAGRLQALIARAADFYGLNSGSTSVPSILIFQRLAAGKPAQVLVNAEARHSYSYTLDCARGVRTLAEAEDAYGQVWHLPTSHPALSARKFVELAARALGMPPRMTVTPLWVLRAGGLFNPQLREVIEMLYQYDHDYLFDSSKFERRFDFTPTSYEQGIGDTVRSMRLAK